MKGGSLVAQDRGSEVSKANGRSMLPWVNRAAPSADFIQQIMGHSAQRGPAILLKALRVKE
jgi:hypothetical protein